MAEEDVYTSVSLATIEMLRHGVTCYIEPGNYFPDATVRAVMGAGMRMVLAASCFDQNKAVTGLMPENMIEDTGRCIAKTEELFDKYPGNYKGRLTVSASFRGMNNSSDKLILALKGIAQRHQAILQTHACYSYFTHDASVVQHGKPEIERLEALGVLDENMLILHAGWLEPNEVALLARRKPTLVCCPSSSLHNGYGNLAVGMYPELMALGINVSLGADHASSGTVDLVQEMRYCACSYKEIRLNPRLMAPEQAIEMATINGARGAGLAHRIGWVETGKDADLVLFGDQPDIRFRKKWAWVSMVGGCAMVSSWCFSGYLSSNKRMMNFHSSGSSGVIDSRLPRCRMRIRASALCRRSSSSETGRVFFTNFTSTFTQRGAARSASGS